MGLQRLRQLGDQRQERFQKPSLVPQQSRLHRLGLLDRHPVGGPEPGLAGQEMVHHREVGVEDREPAEPRPDALDLRLQKPRKLRPQQVDPRVAAGDYRRPLESIRVSQDSRIVLAPGKGDPHPARGSGIEPASQHFLGRVHEALLVQSDDCVAEAIDDAKQPAVSRAEALGEVHRLPELMNVIVEGRALSDHRAPAALGGTQRQKELGVELPVEGFDGEQKRARRHPVLSFAT